MNCPYAQEILKDVFRDAKWFVVFFDECLNEITQASGMDLCIRFWNNEKCRIQDRYWSFVFLGYTTHMDIFKVFQNGIKSLDLTRIIQVSMDGANVNYNFLQKVKDQRKELSSPGLTDFESCNLHTIHGAFKVGVESTAWNLKKVMKACFQLLKEAWQISSSVLSNQV